jgi:hypothetical protein
MVGIIGDRVRQLGENREYLMGWLRVVWIINSELQGGSPRLCRSRHLNVLTHTGHMKSPNWVASCVDEFDDTLPSFTGVQWNSVRATHGVSAEAYGWKMPLGWGRTWPGLLITLWTIATRGAAGPTCVMLLGLYPCKVGYWFESPWHPRTWVMACSLCLNVELSTS